jgi:hypothetical protein
MSEFCSFRWHAPRLDVPESTPVEHVCCSSLHTDVSAHVCICGLVLARYREMRG